MSNKLTQKKNGQPTNAATRNMADQPDYETLVHNIVDFTTTAMLVEQEIEKYRVSDDKYDVRLSLPEITTGSKWASMKSVSHFNLGTALELMLKYLLLRNGRNYPRGREGHKLTVLYDELHRLPSITRQLETTYQEITGGSPPELCRAQ